MVDAATHWKQFYEFALYELAGGGPDPHMRYVTWMSAGLPLAERVWRCGVYVAVYNTAGAEFIWQEWPWDRAVGSSLQEWHGWLTEKWPIPMRRERRAARTVDKLARCLHGYAEWQRNHLPVFYEKMQGSYEANYEVLWAASALIPFFGRYAQFKLLEVLRRSAKFPIIMPDIRPRGGPTPRTTLTFLLPDLASDIDPSSDIPSALRASDRAARIAQHRLAVAYGLELDWFKFEVMLCDYLQSAVGQRQYPGRSNDSEMDYYAKLQQHHPGAISRLWQARSALTPWRVRGEHENRWWGVRKELGPLLTERGTTWSDLRYAYPTVDGKLVELEGYSPTEMLAAAQATLTADI